MTPNDRVLIRGLEAWQRMRLEEIEAEMQDLAEDYRAAQDGLAIAHRNPGQVAEDVVTILWDKLERAAKELDSLEREHQRLMDLDLAALVIEFKGKRKERPRWAFLNYLQ